MSAREEFEKWKYSAQVDRSVTNFDQLIEVMFIHGYKAGLEAAAKKAKQHLVENGNPSALPQAIMDLTKEGD